MTERADIFIVGGGPAGLAAAILARAKGFSVVVADHAEPPIDKACGEGLMPDTVAALETLGISFAAEEAVPFRGIRFLENSAHISVEAAFPARCGLAVRRTVLHAKLAQRAAEMGATLAWGARVTVLGPRRFACDGVPIETRWIIGADGEGSQIRKWAMPEPARYEQTRFGSRQHFQVRPWTDFVEVYWGRSCQIVVTPAGRAEVGVAVMSRYPRVTIENALLEFPELAQRLAGARASSRERGASCALRRLNAVHCGCIALIGDASGSVDPLTGEGLGLAFRQADALTDAMCVHRFKGLRAGPGGLRARARTHWPRVAAHVAFPVVDGRLSLVSRPRLARILRRAATFRAPAEYSYPGIARREVRFRQRSEAGLAAGPQPGVFGKPG